MPATVRRTLLQVYLDGVLLDNVLSARWSFGFDERVSEATIILATVPTDGGTRDLLGNLSGGTPLDANYYASIDIVAGAGDNNVLRFSGLLLQYDYTLWPRAVSLTCRGRLQLVADYENTEGDIDPLSGQQVGGIDLTNGGTGQTDQAMVAQVLGTVGTVISNEPIGGGTIGLDFGSGFIDGTGQVLGTVAWDIGSNAEIVSPFLWKMGQKGLDFIEELDRVCLGFRLYESSGSVLWRAQVYGRPNNDSVYLFTEGVDVLEARATRTIIPARNRVRASGFDPGLGFGPFAFILQESNPFQPADQWHSLEVSSPMIERANIADTGNGLSCEDVANWQMSEVNRELVKVQLTTPLDLVINPGDTVSVLAPSRMHTTQPLWVMRVEGQVDEKGAFSQTFQLLGGGEASTADTPPWDTA